MLMAYREELTSCSFHRVTGTAMRYDAHFFTGVVVHMLLVSLCRIEFFVALAAYEALMFTSKLLPGRSSVREFLQSI